MYPPWLFCSNCLKRDADRTQMILIGEAYVHGKMDGEAMEDFPDRTVETFYIR
jgi:hypothetical protein